MRRQQKLLAASFALVLGAAACTSSGNTLSDATPVIDLDSDELTLTGGLRRVDSCEALLNELRTLGVEHVGPYGFGDGYYGPRFAEDEMADTATTEAAAEAPASTGSDMGGDAGSYSGTNNQEANVDEADLVKTDGSRLVMAGLGYVKVFDVTGELPVETASIKLPDNIANGDLFLSGVKAYLMTSGWSGEPLLDSLSLPGYGGASTAQLLELDLVSGTVGRTVEIDGQYVSARQVGDTIRIVLSATSQNFPFVYPANPGAEASALKANQDLLANSTIDMWLPSYRITDHDEVIGSSRLIDCSRMYLPAEFSGFGTVSVITIDTNDGLTPESVGADSSIGVLSTGETVYSSTERLTIATARWPEFDGLNEPMVDPEFNTALHSFDITDPATTNYVASGSVDGHLLNQYSMSAYDGYLRVATTEGSPWAGNGTSSSSVIVLAEEDNRLVPVGEVANLGKGEQIFAVRFMDDRAYVVTFRQTDPLYVVDLSAPTDPTLLGELKIPGFSAYLHPLPNGRLLGIGQDGTDDGRTTGAAVSIFDVNDPANPVRLSVLNLGDNSFSAVDWDAKAFTWWDPTSTGFIPISWWNYDERTGSEDNGSAAVAVAVGADGLTEIGRIRHPGTQQCEGPYEGTPVPEALESDDAEASFVNPSGPAEIIEPSPDQYCWSYQPEVRRTVVIGDKVYTISEAGLKVNALDGLAELSWTPFAG
ncbi:MAG: beta-propeller domain-containing protein [Acidimicrobiales bacterium]